MIESQDDLRKAKYAIPVIDIWEGSLACLVENEILSHLIFCSYGEARSKFVVETMESKNKLSFAYVAGGLWAINNHKDKDWLITNVLRVPNRLAVLTPGEIRHHSKLIQALKLKIWNDTASACSALMR